MKFIHLQTDMKTQRQTPPALVYADIGTLSFDQTHRILVETPDDTRIEYAQINTHLSTPKDVQPVRFTSTEHHSAGM